MMFWWWNRWRVVINSKLSRQASNFIILIFLYVIIIFKSLILFSHSIRLTSGQFSLIHLMNRVTVLSPILPWFNTGFKSFLLFVPHWVSFHFSGKMSQIQSGYLRIGCRGNFAPIGRLEILSIKSKKLCFVLQFIWFNFVEENT